MRRNREMLSKGRGIIETLEGLGMTGRLLTPEEVGKFTGLSIETLAQWRSQRRGIRFIKISRNVVRYRQTDLDSWIAERTVTVLEDRSGSKGHG
jgi:predicted DNA-binding transcriptional regulator AlpA